MASEKKRLLIIDDEPGFVELVTEYFRSAGYDVRAALNLEDAITEFRQHRPKVVILDFNMPMVTGEKLLPILQRLDPNIRIIVLTGCIEEEVRERFKGLNYFSFFEKGNLSLEKVKKRVDEAAV